jgi:hypothetical protein
LVSGIVSAFAFGVNNVGWPQLGERGDFHGNVWCNVARRVLEHLLALRLTIDDPGSRSASNSGCLRYGAISRLARNAAFNAKLPCGIGTSYVARIFSMTRSVKKLKICSS